MPLNDHIDWPSDLREPSPGDLCTLALVRKIDILAFDLARHLGTLLIGTVQGENAWILTDRAGYGAEARRMDGGTWGGKKSLALVGSKKNLPVGLLTMNVYLDKVKNIVLVEGMPDYFAALAIAIESPANTRVASMLGSGINIKINDPSDPMEMAIADEIKGTHILIIPHGDMPGSKAATKWGNSLYLLGAAAVQIQPLPKDFKDINDYLKAEPSNAKDLFKWIMKYPPRSMSTSLRKLPGNIQSDTLQQAHLPLEAPS